MQHAHADQRNYPGAVEASKDTFHYLNQFLAGHPVIEDEETAREAAKMLKRGKASIDEMEAERDKKVRPLNEQVSIINATYKTAKGPLTRLVDELRTRITAYANAEEARRAEEAEKLRQQAEAAEQSAIEAIRVENEALDNAANGELGVDVGGVISAADQKIADAKKAARTAALAERETQVRLGTGFGKATTLRTKETLLLVDADKALKAIGVTEKIREAILSDARAYRKLHGKLPEGVLSELEKTI